MIKGELVTGLFVNGASVVMRLGVATTILAGVHLIVAGKIDFMLLFVFLLVITRIYAPFDQSLALIAELFLSQVSANRLMEIYDTPAADQIVVLSDGKVAEAGRPSDLYADENSLFRHMAQLQNASAGWSI